MLERCKNICSYTEEEKRENQFYIADSKGVPIWTSDEISVDEESGERCVPWTLANFISCSNYRYPSKAKFYCVIKGMYSQFFVWVIIAIMAEAEQKGSSTESAESSSEVSASSKLIANTA